MGGGIDAGEDMSEDIAYIVRGSIGGFTMNESYTTHADASARLEDICACANELAEGDPKTRAVSRTRFEIKGDMLRDTMDHTGVNAVWIAQQPAGAPIQGQSIAEGAFA